MREICTYGSEGGEATAFPTPITTAKSVRAQRGATVRGYLFRER